MEEQDNIQEDHNKVGNHFGILNSIVLFFQVQLDIKVNQKFCNVFIHAAHISHYFKTTRSSFVCLQLIAFKYCYSVLIFLFSINHLFAYSLNGFRYYNLSIIDPQPLLSSMFKIKESWLLVCYKSNLKNMGRIII